MLFTAALVLAFSSTPASAEAIVMKDAKQLNVCSRIENLLVNLQTEGNSIQPGAFDTANEKLKDQFINLCETSEYDIAKLAAAERDLDLLDQSLGYLKIQTSKRKGSPRILNPFLNRHNNVCASGYGYVSWGIWGDRAHQRRRSCHNSGDAIDIHAITHQGKVYTGKTQRFRDYVSCMHKEFGTVFGNSSHTDHVHIQLRPCRKIGGTLQFSAAGYVSGGSTPANPVANIAPAKEPVKAAVTADKAEPKKEVKVAKKSRKVKKARNVRRAKSPQRVKTQNSSWSPWSAPAFWEK